ncbi:MAG: hypothetical protein AAF138_09385 [Planctomycetota bacterium]
MHTPKARPFTPETGHACRSGVRRARPRAAAVAMGLAGVTMITAIGCGSTPMYKHRHTLELAAHTPGNPSGTTGPGRLEARSNNGSITLRQHEEPSIRVVAEVRATSPERARESQLIATEDASGGLGVSIEWPDGRRESNEGAALYITGPAFHGVHLETSNGSIRASDQFGEGFFDTSNASVRVDRHAGPVTIDTSNGRVSLSLARGERSPFSVRTSNARVGVDLPASFDGVIETDTSNADVKIRAHDRQLVIRRKSDSSAAVSFGASWESERSRIRTSNGSVSIDAEPLETEYQQ